MDFIAIIPARYASSRFPGKPLAKLGGVEMIVRVCRRVREAGIPLAVATDDIRIADCVEAAGFRAVMTSPDHCSGTDRIREAYDKLGGKYDVVINVQGDEPFIDPRQLTALMDCFLDASTDIATLVRPYPADGSFEGLEDPNLVKVTVDDGGNALLFSRSVIPYVRGLEKADWPSSQPYLTHIGVYAYRGEVLRKLTLLPRSPLEISESLEQLRWLQAGYRIRTAFSDTATIGIDTPADLEAAEAFLSRQNAGA